MILEPVVGNMGLVPPTPEFLDGLRNLTQRHGALLIYDEVMTGFRLAYGGCSSAVQTAARSDRARQDRRRWSAGWGLRRSGGHHGARSAGGTGVPGGDAVGQSVGDGGRCRDGAGVARTAALHQTGDVE